MKNFRHEEDYQNQVEVKDEGASLGIKLIGNEKKT